jgi:hypothetical protein
MAFTVKLVGSSFFLSSPNTIDGRPREKPIINTNAKSSARFVRIILSSNK